MDVSLQMQMMWGSMWVLKDAENGCRPLQIYLFYFCAGNWAASETAGFLTQEREKSTIHKERRAVSVPMNLKQIIYQKN